MFDVQVEQKIELPRIYGEGKDPQKNSERRSVDDFIEMIEFL
jgi:hypothetical protein